MQRRTLLRGAAAAVAALGTTGIALNQHAGRARAGGGMTLGSATVTSDDGTVDYVAIYGDSVISWDGFETPATHFGIDIDLVVDDGSSTKTYDIHETGGVALSQGDSWGGSGEHLSGEGTSGTIRSNVGYSNGSKDPSVYWDLVAPSRDPTQGSNSYPLPQNPAPASALTVDADGTSRTYTLTLKSTYTWYDGDPASGGTKLFAETFTSSMSVTVENVAKSSSASSGSQADGSTAG